MESGISKKYVQLGPMHPKIWFVAELTDVYCPRLNFPLILTPNFGGNWGDRNIENSLLPEKKKRNKEPTPEPITHNA